MEAPMVTVSLANDDEEELNLGKRAELQNTTIDECRICRSSALELLEAEAAVNRVDRGGCCCWRRAPRHPPLRRLRCACTGSVRHVCARCYRRYYVARGLVECEICRQPTGLEGEAFNIRDSDGACNALCRRLTAFCCSEEVRYFVYATFILVAFVTAFALFFVFSAAEDQKDRSTTPPPRQESQRQTERLVFAGIALVVLAFAVAYIGYSYRQYQRGETDVCYCWRCCVRRHSRGVELLTSVRSIAATTRLRQPQPQISVVG